MGKFQQKSFSPSVISNSEPNEPNPPVGVSPRRAVSQRTGLKTLRLGFLVRLLFLRVPPRRLNDLKLLGGRVDCRDETSCRRGDTAKCLSWTSVTEESSTNSTSSHWGALCMRCFSVPCKTVGVEKRLVVTTQSVVVTCCRRRNTVTGFFSSHLAVFTT